MTVGSSALRVWAGAVAVSGCLVATSQPRTSTLPTCCAEDSTERNRSRSLPSSSTSGLGAAPLLAVGAVAAVAGGAKENEPSRTATSNPLSRVSRSSTSQSVCPAWDRCGNTVRVDLTSPTLSPARWATLVAMSDAVICT